jgi:bifunctional UDP-N-acetylglucosamine pyrophosphorylase / glucosamine-1-phosphate N-acetyltransferase
MSVVNTNSFAAVILAAGKGTRMKTKLPKVMHELDGKPLVRYVVDSVKDICDRKVLVISADNGYIHDLFGDEVEYAVQEKQLGTGHAVMSAEGLLNNQISHVIVLYGDMPFVTRESIERLMKKHTDKNNTITLMTAVLPNFDDWRESFYSFGRIVRGQDGHITKILEMKDANNEELETKEINPSYFCFKSDWLWENLKKLDNNNAAGEYYLTDLVKKAIDDGEKISSIEIDPKETLGVNSQDDLKAAKSIDGLNN